MNTKNQHPQLTGAEIIWATKEWERLQAGKKPTLKELLLSDDYFRGEMDIPPRGMMKHRKPPEF